MKPWEYGILRVSDNQRYLCNGDQPFFWLGDTAWCMGVIGTFDKRRCFAIFKEPES